MYSLDSRYLQEPWKKEALTWQMKAIQFAEALFDVLGCIEDHDIQAHTGLPQEDCDRIAELRTEARDLVNSK